MTKYESQYSDELMHHGIKGQQWGKQNGPPYPLDREEHMAVISSSRDSKAQAKELRKKAREDRRAAKAVIKATKKAKKAEELKKKSEAKAEAMRKKMAEERAKRDKKFEDQKNAKDSKELTNDELRERIARLKLEDEYKKYMAQARVKPKNQGIISKALQESAGTALKATATAAMVFAGKQILARMLNAEPSWKGSGSDGRDDAKEKYKEIFPKPKK